MERIDKIIVDAVFDSINDFNKVDYINDIETLNEINEQIDIEFGCNLCNLSETEKKVWYFMYGYVYKLNKKVNVDELVNIGLIYNMTV